MIYGVVGLTASLIFLADLILKTYLRTNFAYQSIPILQNIFHLTVVFNRGAAFGILKGNTALLIFFGLTFVVFFVYFIKKETKPSLFFLICSGLILGGALSNLADRIFLGFIVDYIDFRVWPVFNLSDSGISVGVVALILRSLFTKGKQT